MDVVQTQRKMARRTTSREAVMATPLASGAITPRKTVTVSDKTTEMPMPEVQQETTPTTTAPPAGTAVTRPGPFARFRRQNAAPSIPRPQRPRRAFSAPAAPGRRRRRRLLMEDHYRVDPERRVVLPGLPQQDANWSRDLHDFFNLIVLIPVVALNVMNWNWDLVLRGLLRQQQSLKSHNQLLAEAWTGEWFDWFFGVTVLYFVIDLVWIGTVPTCVKSPATILQHHVATLLYILIPYFRAEFRWCMGACMIVELNTWFLIARRVFNKQGFPPWTILNLGSLLSIRVKLISVFFYVTWIGIRCLLYPYLMPRFYQNWLEHSQKVGTPYNLVALSVPLHAVFCLLNLKWTVDLLLSKIRFWTRNKKQGKGGGGAAATSNGGVDKGL